MTTDLSLRPFDQVRHEIAALILGARDRADDRVGEVVLWPHQREAVTRVRASIAEFGGALLADDVGTGKTFVALAVASRHASPLVVAPAALREGWRVAGERAGCALEFASFESLSRGYHPRPGHGMVIVDEAHHARNPLTRRYAALAALVAGVPTLLLTATPIHNHRDDLIALLALFLGASAATLDDAAFARCVVRRDRRVLDETTAIPTIRGPISLAAPAIEDATPDAILALPPPVPAADSGTAPSLLAITLLRQWASSQGALLAAVRRRLARAHALASTLDSGHYPTRAELAAWTLGDDAQQLVMSELLAPVAHAAPAAELRAAVAAHIEGLRVLRRAASADPGIDRRRAQELRDAWARHPGARSIAFTQFAETVDAYWSELREHPRVCALTAAGGRVAGGEMTRGEALGSFAPGSGGRLDRARRIDALIVTDLASEGLDLQDASVLIHLDLPWTPARLEQRVGRVVRPGSPHEIVHVYVMEPPILASSLLDIRRRLEEKLAAARAAFGDVMPDLGLAIGGEREASLSRLTLAAPVAAERIAAMLRRWIALSSLSAHPPPAQGALPLTSRASGIPVSIARTGRDGWLAVVGADPSRLVAALGDRVSDDPSLVVDVCAIVDAMERETAPIAPRAPAVAAGALRRLRDWLDARRGASLAGVPEISVVRGRRRVLASIAELADAPASARLAAATLASRALAVASGPLPASVERALTAEASAPALLAPLAALAPCPTARGTLDDRVQALIVLTP